MGFKCGVVGLPNVGKSTLFNALVETAKAQAANYPFCTIEPNTGQVAVPDPRLDVLGRLAKSAILVPTQLIFVDIAGLVRGASKGEGLGNRFLAHIREVDMIVHVLRCFADSNIVHVEGRVDPLADAEAVETELMLADLESLERRIPAANKRAKGGDEDAKAEIALMEEALAALREGRPARLAITDPEKQEALKRLQLLTGKPVLYVANIDEGASASDAAPQRIAAKAAAEGAGFVTISAAVEAEVAEIADPAERQAFLDALGVTEPGLARLIRQSYALLNLLTFFTAGPKETRAWTVRAGARAPEAAGVIHTDFEKGFIRAEAISYDDYVACGGESGAREAGKIRVEGKDYVVQEGDILHFRFQVS